MAMPKSKLILVLEKNSNIRLDFKIDEEPTISTRMLILYPTEDRNRVKKTVPAITYSKECVTKVKERKKNHDQTSTFFPYFPAHS